MQFETLAIILTGTLVLGTVLYVPGHFIAKWLLRRAPQKSNARLCITPTGYIVYGLLVTLLLVGFAQQYVAPGSTFGNFMGSWFGHLVFSASLIVVFVVVEKLLVKAGIPCVRRKTV